MAIRLRETPDRIRVQFVRDWSDDCAGPRQVADQAAETGKPVLIDFANLDFMTSAIIGQLVILIKCLRQANAEVTMCNASDNLLEAFKITRLNRAIPLMEDPDDLQ